MNTCSARERRRENLDRDGAIEPRIAGAIDFTHTACADERDNFINAEARAG
jgi:hypothetical protein